MKLLLELKDEDIGLRSKKVKMKKCSAARAILFKNNKIALLHVTKYDYHKLPGGGVEKGETVEEGLKREILEEAGCDIEIIGEVGKVIEHRNRTDYGILQKDSGTFQTSYCYIARVIKQGKTNFDDGELAAGYKLEWVTLNKAIGTIEKEKPKNYEGKFIVKRDLALLKAAAEIVGK